MILDAAERAFAERGYHGTTIREVFKAAGLNSGLMNYYFRSKDELFTQTVLRRHAQLKERFTNLFSRSPEKAVRSAQDCIQAYVEFFFEAAFSGKSEFRHYIVILANSASVFDDKHVSDLLSNFDFITERMLLELRMAIPGANDATLREAVFYLESAVTTMLLTERFRQTRLAHMDVTKLQMLSTSMAHFFAQGSLSLVAKDNRAT